jgi:hypothetical protein
MLHRSKQIVLVLKETYIADEDGTSVDQQLFFKRQVGVVSCKR